MLGDFTLAEVSDGDGGRPAVRDLLEAEGDRRARRTRPQGRAAVMTADRVRREVSGAGECTAGSQ